MGWLSPWVLNPWTTDWSYGTHPACAAERLSFAGLDQQCSSSQPAGCMNVSRLAHGSDPVHWLNWLCSGSTLHTGPTTGWGDSIQGHVIWPTGLPNDLDTWQKGMAINTATYPLPPNLSSLQVQNQPDDTALWAGTGPWARG